MWAMTLMFEFIYREQPIDYGTLDEYLRKSCPKLGIKDVEGLYYVNVRSRGLVEWSSPFMDTDNCLT
jgi:hypothetical protein